MDSKHPAFTTRSFFKVLMPGFEQKLNLPPAVSKELEKCKSQTVILESRIGRWKMGICRNEEIDVICFKQGWPEFVRRHSLSMGDFLVFQPTTKHLHFNVSVFDPTACEKEFRDETKKKATEALDFTTEEETLYFVKTMPPNYGSKRARVNIPRRFLRLNKLGKQRNATLRDPKGRAWRVKLAMGGKDGVRERMGGAGWCDFYASNALSHGCKCVFKLIPPKITPDTIFFHVHFLPA